MNIIRLMKTLVELSFKLKFGWNQSSSIFFFNVYIVDVKLTSRVNGWTRRWTSSIGWKRSLNCRSNWRWCLIETSKLLWWWIRCSIVAIVSVIDWKKNQNWIIIESIVGWNSKKNKEQNKRKTKMAAQWTADYNRGTTANGIKSLIAENVNNRFPPGPSGSDVIIDN